MLFNSEKWHLWRFAFGSWGAFIVIAVLYLIFDFNIYLMFAFLTSAIIMTIWNVFYVLYTKHKSKKKTTHSEGLQ